MNVGKGWKGTNSQDFGRRRNDHRDEHGATWVGAGVGAQGARMLLGCVRRWAGGDVQ